MKWLLGLVALGGLGCGAPHSTMGTVAPLSDGGGGADLGAPPLCTPGAQVACACPGGAASVQVCQANGTLGACACGTIADAGPADAGPADAGPADGGPPDAPDGGVEGCQFRYQCGSVNSCVDGCCRASAPTCLPRQRLCRTNADCRGNSVCQDGACRWPCDTAEQCGQISSQFTSCARFGGLGPYCLTPFEASPECARNADCGASAVCVNAQCIVP